jgi:two-component system OmpR family sensor kinase
MTLRTRLIAGFVAVFLTLGVASVVVTLVQRSYLLQQLDNQLESFTPGASTVIGRLTVANGRAGGLETVFSEYYIGHIDRAGRLETLVAPTADPELVPNLPSGLVPGTPRTVASASGGSARVRVIETELSNGSIGVFGLSTGNVEAATRRLVFTEAISAAIVLAAMGLVVFWVIRLGIRPIRRMTAAADAITAGSTDHRVDVPADGTEAARLGKALNTMIDTTQATESRLRQFVSDASHELRTPLTTLRGYAALYEAGGFTEKAELDDAMRRMGQEATRMSRIVDELLLLAKLDEHGAPSPEPVEIGAVLNDLASDIRVVQPGRPVEVTCDAPLTVMIDRDHLVQAVSALTTNALRHTDPFAQLALRAFRVADRARIEVADRGAGIAEADVTHLFDRFYRADSARSRTSGGNGLGLAIVASIISSNNGTYGVQSTVGVGSTFWFELPVAPAAPLVPVS